MLAALGVEEDGSKRLVGLEQLVVRESGASWFGFVGDLAKRGLARPAVLVTDGRSRRVAVTSAGSARERAEVAGGAWPAALWLEKARSDTNSIR